MHIKLRSAIALLVALTGLIVAATALAAETDPQTGGTPAPAIEGSGGVAGPEPAPEARRSQQPAQQEEPPQVETTPEEPAPEEEEEETGTAPDEAPTAPGDDVAAAAPGAGSGGGGGLPTTGLEIGALTAVGLGLLLAGVALRRRPAA